MEKRKPQIEIIMETNLIRVSGSVYLLIPKKHVELVRKSYGVDLEELAKKKAPIIVKILMKPGFVETGPAW